MKYLDLSLDCPEADLALDEALLEIAEEESQEYLRIWEPSQYFVVLGYSNKVKTEVHHPFYKDQRIPILRRASGGGTVLQGPGCLNYAVVLKINRDADLAGITNTNRYVMKRQKDALQSILTTDIEIAGFTDLTHNTFKFSGNAQRRKKNHLLFHGTFLIDFDLKMISKTLSAPSKQPEYRAHREHQDFLINLNLAREKLKSALKKVWQVKETLTDYPKHKVDKLISEKYSKDEWNLKF